LHNPFSEQMYAAGVKHPYMPNAVQNMRFSALPTRNAPSRPIIQGMYLSSVLRVSLMVFMACSSRLCGSNHPPPALAAAGAGVTCRF
jgi:hypothetical protein